MTERRLGLRLADALLAIALLALALGTPSCSKNGGTDTVDDDDDSDNPPSRVTDLAVAQVTPASVTLRWTAPHGGSPSMVAQSYDLRAAAAAIDGTNWDAAVQIADEPPPLPSGLEQTMLITGLPSDTTIYFALRTRSQAEVWSDVSNSTAATLPPETEVAFADSALEAVIREVLGIPDAPLRTSDLVGVEEVQASSRGIASIAGIEYCVSLIRLGIRGNAITGLGPLAGLARMTDLDASDNDIVDIQALAGLSSMVNLSLGGNAVSDLSPLQSFERLNVLYLNGNQISSITPLAGCTRLNHLFLSSNLISDLGPLTGLIYLASLDLSYNAITDLAPLVANAGLDTGTEIWLAGNPLSATARDAQIPALRARGAIVHDR